MHSSYSWLSSFEWAFLVGRAIGVLGGGSVFAEALFRRTAELSLLWELPMGLWQMSGIARCPVAPLTCDDLSGGMYVVRPVVYLGPLK